MPAGTAQLAVSTKAPRWALCGAQQGSSAGSEPPSRLGCVHGAALPKSQDFPVHPSLQVQDPSVALHSPPFWQEQVCWQPSPYCCGWQPAGQGHSAGYSRKQVPSWDRRVPGCPAGVLQGAAALQLAVTLLTSGTNSSRWAQAVPGDVVARGPLPAGTQLCTVCTIAAAGTHWWEGHLQLPSSLQCLQAVLAGQSFCTSLCQRSREAAIPRWHNAKADDVS